MKYIHARTNAPNKSIYFRYMEKRAEKATRRPEGHSRQETDPETHTDRPESRRERGPAPGRQGKEQEKPGGPTATEPAERTHGEKKSGKE